MLLFISAQWCIYAVSQKKTVTLRLMSEISVSQACTEIVLLLYRLCTEIVLPMYRSCIGRIDMYRTRPWLYQNWHVPKSPTLCPESVMYRYGSYPMKKPIRLSLIYINLDLNTLMLEASTVSCAVLSCGVLCCPAVISPTLTTSLSCIYASILAHKRRCRIGLNNSCTCMATSNPYRWNHNNLHMALYKKSTFVSVSSYFSSI